MSSVQKNVLGEPLELCCTDPMTGFFRDGYCHTQKQDYGKHTVCAVMTQEFLEFSYNHGNDLITPMPEFGFPGLKPGDGWCLCLGRWYEAYQAGVAPPVKLAASHEKTLERVSLEELKKYEYSGD